MELFRREIIVLTIELKHPLNWLHTDINISSAFTTVSVHSVKCESNIQNYGDYCGHDMGGPHRRPTESDLKKNFRRLMKDLKIRVLPLLLQINWQTLYINDNQTIVISREKRFQHFFRYFCLIFIKSDFSINKIFKSFYNFINFLQISYKRIFRISFYHFFIMSLKFIFIRKIDIKMDFLFEFFVWFSYLWVKAMDGTDIWFDLLFTSFEFTWNVLNVYIFS